MHSCLEVQEILDHIFTLVYDGSSGRPARHDLIPLALTCHYFAETALDILWHTQTNLVPLIKTLPSRCWIEDPPTGFDRMFALTLNVPTEEELKRLMSYAQRIRQINYLPYPFHHGGSWYGHRPSSFHFGFLATTDDGIYPLDLYALKVLSSYRRDQTVPLFPCLLRLEFVDVAHAAKCLDIFLRTKGISLSLQWSDAEGSVTSLFPVIEQYALNMQELDLGPLQDKKKANCAHLSRLVRKMTDLRSLSCASRVLDSPAIQHLASLPHLRSLTIANTSSQISQALRSLSREHPSFPELQRLVMPQTDFSSLADLFGQLVPLQLRDVLLHVSQIRDNLDMHVAFEVLKQGSSQPSNIQRILMKYTPSVSSDTRRQRSSQAQTSRYLITTSTLQPLLSFRHLLVLELDIPIQVNLGDNDFMTMANAWPSLKRLVLGQLGEWHSHHLVTYHGFLHLLQRCPELEYLAFSFDAASEVPSPSEIPAACVNTNITYLYVGDSHIGSHAPKTVATLLAFILPKLCGIGGVWLAESQGELPPWAMQWDRVVKAFKDFKNDGLGR